MTTKIASVSVRAFLSGRKLTKGNTKIEDGKYYLYNSLIAIRMPSGGVAIRTCGWPTKTTLSRLNEIARNLGEYYIGKKEIYLGKLNISI